MTQAGRTAAIWSITVVVATAVLSGLFNAIDPQPAPMTIAVQGFSSAEMNAWMAAVLLVVAGTALFSRYIARSIVDAATSKAPRWAVLAFTLVVAALIVAGVFFGQIAVCGTLTLLVLMGLNEVVAAARRAEEQPGVVRTHENHDDTNNHSG
jgi:hypothetical protein